LLSVSIGPISFSINSLTISAALRLPLSIDCCSRGLAGVGELTRLNGDGLAGVERFFVLSKARDVNDGTGGLDGEGSCDEALDSGVAGAASVFWRLGSLSSATSDVKSGLSEFRDLLSILFGDIPGPRYRILRLAGDSPFGPTSDRAGLPTENRGPGLPRIESIKRFGVEGPAGWVSRIDLTCRGLSIPAVHLFCDELPGCSASISSINVLMTFISCGVMVCPFFASTNAVRAIEAAD
jgi:hypothetical protein